MGEIRYCLDCSVVGRVNVHGDCGTCSSTAVVLAESIFGWQAAKAPDVYELEKLLKIDIDKR